MKAPFLISSVAVMVVGGVTLFLGCGAESPQTKPGQNSPASSANASANASTPSSTNATGAVANLPAPRTVMAPPKLSPGVDEVVQLAQSGVGDEVLQAFIENSQVTYNLSVEEILYLHDLGLSSETIAAMVRRSQLIQDQSATSTAATAPTASTNNVGPAVGQTAIQTPNPTPAQPPVFAGDANAANAYAVTPPQQVNYNYFYETLAPYGTWVQVPDYGWCWQPTVSVVDASWRPYCNRGRWLWTDSGWYWQSDYSWGWAPFHYGRWYRSPAYGWVWAPDTTWGPAWVTWRYSDTYCGWAPLPPGACFETGVGFTYGGGPVSVGFDFGLVPDCYTFIPTIYFCDRTPWYYCLPRHHIVAVFNRTTVINNYVIAPNDRHIIHIGPGTNAIASVARSEIRKVRLHDANPVAGTLIKGDRLGRDGKTLEVFRPKLPEQAAAPPTEITRRQQELRKRSDILAKSESTKWTGVGSTRKASVDPSGAGSSERALPPRGTPLISPRGTGRTGENQLPSSERTRGDSTATPAQVIERSQRTPLVSNSPRLERRNPDSAPLSPGVATPFRSEPAYRQGAGFSPRPTQPTLPAREERFAGHPEPQNSQSEPRAQSPYGRPTFPGEEASRPAPAPGQVITPPVYREEGRKPEAPPVSRFSQPPAYNVPAHSTISPRSPDSGFNPPAYRPPQNFSPPPVVSSRPVEASTARPSSPPPSYSPPPAASRPQPSPQQSQPRNEGGRRQP